MDKTVVLIADDDESILDLVRSTLEREGIEVVTANNGKDAILLEEQVHPDLVILDIVMPILDGFEAFNIIRNRRSGIEYVPIIFISGSKADKRAIAGLRSGADDFVRKPFDPNELVARIKNLLKMKNLVTSVESIESVIFTIVRSVQARDFYTAGHSHRVCELSKKIGREIKFTEKEIVTLHKASLLHDVGKIGISDLILNKPGKLLSDEFEKIKEHPDRGVEICNSLHFGVDVLSIVRHHHEKLDGSGYPDGLKGKEINKLVRVVTVADIYDALTTKRPYHSSRTPEEAIIIIKKEADEGKLDQAMVKVLEKIVKEEEDIKKQQEEKEEREEQARQQGQYQTRNF